MKVAYHVPTQESYDNLMKEFDLQNIRWGNGDKATEFKGWLVDENRCVAMHLLRNNWVLGYGYLQGYIAEGYNIKEICR